MNSEDTKPENPWYYYLDSQLIKKKKPFLSGADVHIKKWDGCYRVHETSVYSFAVRRKGVIVHLPWSEFRCLKGHGMSEAVFIKRDLKSLIQTIDISVSTQLVMNTILKEELKNLRKTII